MERDNHEEGKTLRGDNLRDSEERPKSLTGEEGNIRKRSSSARKIYIEPCYLSFILNNILRDTRNTIIPDDRDNADQMQPDQVSQKDDDEETPGAKRKDKGLGKVAKEESRRMLLWSCQRRRRLNATIIISDIDQMEAKGDQACGVLAVIIADHILRSSIPSKSQLDDLIRYGSRIWRENFGTNLSLQSILEANIRPGMNSETLIASSEIGKSLFNSNPEQFDGQCTDFQFESVWDRLIVGVYIVCWSGHFFVLVLEEDTSYIIDSLGRNLYEGCKGAHIIVFDPTSKLSIFSEDQKQSRESAPVCHQYTGKEACKWYIKTSLEIPKLEPYTGCEALQAVQIDFDRVFYLP